MTKVRRYFAWSLVAALSLAACSGVGSSAPSPPASQPAASSAPADARDSAAVAPAYAGPIRLVTLGDGYTYGFETSAPRRDSWPSQLVDAFKRDDVRLLLWNLAEQSHTSDLVIEEQLDQATSLEPDLVTLQVGANDIYAHETEYYRENIATILDKLLAVLPPERIFAITTPDHTLTDRGDAHGSLEDGHAAVAQLNATLTEIAAERDIDVIDISQVNELVTADPTLVIDEGPYPTAKQYAGWVEVIGPYVREALSTTEP